MTACYPTRSRPVNHITNISTSPLAGSQIQDWFTDFISICQSLTGSAVSSSDMAIFMFSCLILSCCVIQMLQSAVRIQHWYVCTGRSHYKRNTRLRSSLCAWCVRPVASPKMICWCCVISVFYSLSDRPMCSWHFMSPCPRVWPCRPVSRHTVLPHRGRNDAATTSYLNVDQFFPRPQACLSAHTCLCVLVCFMMQGCHAFCLNMRTTGKEWYRRLHTQSSPSCKSALLPLPRPPLLLIPPRQGEPSGLMC